MKTTLDASKLLGFRLVVGGGASAAMDAKIGGKDGNGKSAPSILIGGKDGNGKSAPNILIGAKDGLIKG